MGACTYDVFGSVRSHSGADSEWTFTGEQMDLNGLLYLRARYYDPSLGRFLSSDPWPGLAFVPQSQNRYSYVMNNPALYVDPYGYFPPSLGDVVDGARRAAGAAGGAVRGGAEAVGGGAAAGAQWLGEDYHWATVGAAAGYTVAGAGVIVLTGGAATPLVVQVGAAVIIPAGLATGGTLTAVSLRGPAGRCRAGSQLACAEFWSGTTLSGYGWVAPIKAFGTFGRAASILRMAGNFGLKGLDWLYGQLQDASGPKE